VNRNIQSGVSIDGSNKINLFVAISYPAITSVW